ncbi:MAG TPA: ATP synthase F1 subunit gamma [Phycisphaerae bacterium]|jgi:F-type H+-transporting ATPase subunit gamma|nr:ATP synthase F1 subunit gamma [Phycisphaerae bacterium]HPC22986.1 ATP synthase F1 subunit gamma [Phycisphaerae bacterium]HRS28736.1 ATP synthase F1 subunit gamma [Phycisphaerae bacterium]HRT43065.1 ATP synthase F1 subunit gamma [Phycisphaerae bacterium]
MAKARAVVKRRRAVQNIRKITETMQLIATARYQKAYQRATATQPYTAHIREMLASVAQQAGLDDPLLKPNAGVPRSLMLVITSNRGLAGAYNASVLRTAIHRRAELVQAGITPDLEVVGKKGIAYFRFLGFPITTRITDVDDRIAFARVADMAERYMNAYRNGEIARVDVAYMRFHSMASQRPAALQLLPIEPPSAPESEAARAQAAEFEFSPPAPELLARLVPETVKTVLFQCFNDALLSEQVARMVAMKAATEAAGDMIKYLTRQYNRARQAQITLELADIVGGAEAVK